MDQERIRDNRKIDTYLLEGKECEGIAKKIINKSVYIGVSKELCKWAIKQCDAKKNYLLENIIIKEKIVKKQIKKTRGNRLILVSNI